MVRGSLMFVRLLAWLLLFQWSMGAGWAGLAVPGSLEAPAPICGVAGTHGDGSGSNNGQDHRHHDGATDPCCWASAVHLGLAGSAEPSLRLPVAFALVAPAVVREGVVRGRLQVPQQPRAPPVLS